MKWKFSSLRKACSSINCSWTKFYRFTKLAKPKPRKCAFTRKLSQEQIDNIQNHMAGDDVTFPLPEAKYSGKQFFSSSVIHAQKMYNILLTCTHKISLSTYCKYHPKLFVYKEKFHSDKVVVRDVKTLRLLQMKCPNIWLEFHIL